MDGLVSAVGNLNVQPSLRRKPVSAGSTNTPPAFCAELEGSTPTIPQPQTAGDYEQGLIPVEKTPPPDHEGLIPLHAPHPVHAVSQGSSSSSPTTTAVPPPPPQTPGSSTAGYTPAAYPSWPQSHAPQPQPVLVSSTHSFPPPPPVSSTTLPPPTAGTHTPGQKLGDFASSVFSKETVKWSKKTASRFGGALKNAATSAHEAATKAQVAAVRAAEQRKQRQASLVASQQQQCKPVQAQVTTPQSPQHWTSSHHQPQSTTSPQQAWHPFVPPTPPHHGTQQQPQMSYWPVTQTSAPAVVPVSQVQGPHVIAGSQTHAAFSPPPPPRVGSQYPQASAQPLSPPPLHAHTPPAPPKQPHLPPHIHHFQQQHQQQFPDHRMTAFTQQHQYYQPPPPPQPQLRSPPPPQQAQTTHSPWTSPPVASAGPLGGGGSFPVPHPPFPPSTASSQPNTAATPIVPKEDIKKPVATAGGNVTPNAVGAGMTALAAVGGLTRLLIAATTGEDVGDMDFGGGGGGEEAAAFDSLAAYDGAGGGAEEGGGGTGYPNAYPDPSSAMASTCADQQAALEANHFANMMNAQANANALSYVSDTTTTYDVISDPYGYGSYGYTPNPASYV